MKSLASLIFFFSLFSVPAIANQAVPTKEVQIGVNNVYVPGGFDSNSDVFVIVNGVFPNGCYKWGRAEVKNTDAHTHEIKSIAQVSQGMCIMVMMPFQEEIRLGKFASGEHILRFVNHDGTYLEKTMIIE